jgi:hypothetical protein
MIRHRYFFVAGDQVHTSDASSVLDAWLTVEMRAESKQGPGVPAEFRRLPITAYLGTESAEGIRTCEEIGTRTWEGWHAELMRDTYGDDWRGAVDHAAGLLR